MTHPMMEKTVAAVSTGLAALVGWGIGLIAETDLHIDPASTSLDLPTVVSVVGVGCTAAWFLKGMNDKLERHGEQITQHGDKLEKLVEAVSSRPCMVDSDADCPNRK